MLGGKVGRSGIPYLYYSSFDIIEFGRTLFSGVPSKTRYAAYFLDYNRFSD